MRIAYSPLSKRSEYVFGAARTSLKGGLSHVVNDFSELLKVEGTDLSTAESQASHGTRHAVGIAFNLDKLYHVS